MPNKGRKRIKFYKFYDGENFWVGSPARMSENVKWAKEDKKLVSSLKA
jgi:hypothetical protein